MNLDDIIEMALEEETYEIIDDVNISHIIWFVKAVFTMSRNTLDVMVGPLQVRVHEEKDGSFLSVTYGDKTSVARSVSLIVDPFESDLENAKNIISMLNEAYYDCVYR